MSRTERTPQAIVLVNLGTPEAATPTAVRRFLKQFLSDPRVVEIPRVVWWLILRLFVLPFRPKRVAEAYKIIWTERGSPLRWITEDQTRLLAEKLADRFAHPPTVTHAMTYGEPAIADTLDELVSEGNRHILVLPMYPQYSGSTTGAVYDQVAAYIRKRRAVPGLSIIDAYYDHPAYIQALANSVHAFWRENGKGDHLLFSFHGIPVSYVEKGDPYTTHCEGTTTRVVAELGVSTDEYSLSYQSRFGKAEWVKPYTEPRLVELAEAGVRTVDVICPAFATDCLETIEEIAEQANEVFIEAGGEALRLIPCLNASDAHISALVDMVSPFLDARKTP